jgi:thiol:disulfide interchange protein
MRGFKNLVILSLAAGSVSFGSLVVSQDVLAWPKHKPASDSSTQAGGSKASELLQWNRELGKALKQAQKENKYVLGDVYTDWCGWCKHLDETTFRDPEFVDYANKKFVFLKINAEDHGEGERTARANHVSGFPCALIFDGSGKVVGQISGFKPTKEYKMALSTILTSVNPQQTKSSL